MRVSCVCEESHLAVATETVVGSRHQGRSVGRIGSGAVGDVVGLHVADEVCEEEDRGEWGI